MPHSSMKPYTSLALLAMSFWNTPSIAVKWPAQQARHQGRHTHIQVERVCTQKRAYKQLQKAGDPRAGKQIDTHSVKARQAL